MFCFFRRLNDLDQLAPIVFEYSKNNKNKNIHYICTNLILIFNQTKLSNFS